MVLALQKFFGCFLLAARGIPSILPLTAFELLKSSITTESDTLKDRGKQSWCPSGTLAEKAKKLRARHREEEGVTFFLPMVLQSIFCTAIFAAEISCATS